MRDTSHSGGAAAAPPGKPSRALGAGRGGWRITKAMLRTETVALLFVCAIGCSRVAVDRERPGDKEQTTYRQIQALELSLRLFHDQTGRYPTDSEGLEALRSNPGIPKWDGPYFAIPIPSDRWGSPFRYSIVDGKPRIVSAGPDKSFGSPDDISN